MLSSSSRLAETYVTASHTRCDFKTFNYLTKCEINTERNAEINKVDHDEHEKHLAIIVEAKSHWYRSNGVEVVQHEFPHKRPC